MAIQNNFPAISPSLSLDFAAVQALDPRITFARASAATYYGTETAKAEENLFLQSQALATTWGSLRVARTNNADTAPDGTTTATRVTQLSGQTTIGLVNQNQTAVANSTYSVFAKPDGKNFIAIQTTSSPVRRTFFNISTGAVGASDAAHTASIVDAGNGWYRCIVVNSASGDTGAGFYIADTDGSGTVVDSGSVLFWGAQLEIRDSATAYTPTTTQPITNFVPVLESAAAGEARFDHNPVTGESLGLLIEESRTNLILRSEEFDDAFWSKSRLSINPNVIIAPDGTLTGHKLVPNTEANANHQLHRAAITVGAGALTLSVIAKKGEYDFIYLGLVNDGGFTKLTRQVFNLSTGVLGNAKSEINATITNSSITNLGNDWYRCSLTMVADATSVFRIEYQATSTDTLGIFAGDGFSGIFIWGAQLEAGAFPTSYVKTTTAQVTRAADAASMTGANFSSWYRQDEGTLYSESSRPFVVPIGQFLRVMHINDGTDNNRIMNNYQTANVGSFVVTVGSTTQASINPPASDVLRKLASAYKVNDFATSVNSGTVGTDTSGTIPVVNQMNLGSGPTGGGILSGHIRKVAYYPLRLSDTNLVALTS